MYKQVKLKADEFNPHRSVKSFWQVPKAVVAHNNLSLGAKLLYGVLVGFAGRYGTAYPSQQKLREVLGGASIKTVYLWQKELVDEGLIRVKQKGRGLPNNYYFLRSPLLNNAHENEFKPGARYTFVDPSNGEELFITKEQAMQIYDVLAGVWFTESIQGNLQEFPKPFWQYNRREFGKVKKHWEQKLQDYFDAS